MWAVARRPTTPSGRATIIDADSTGGPYEYRAGFEMFGLRIQVLTTGVHTHADGCERVIFCTHNICQDRKI
jgi:hypothetical protein